MDTEEAKEDGEITDDSRLVGRVVMLEERNALLEKRFEQMEKRMEQMSSETKPPPKMMMGYNFYAKPEEDLTDRYAKSSVELRREVLLADLSAQAPGTCFRVSMRFGQCPRQDKRVVGE